MTPEATTALAEAERHLSARNILRALTGFNIAESLGADCDRCSADRWLAQMLLGNFEAAWRESDLIRERGAPDPHRFWQGEDLDGRRVILRSLHGLGDAVQFLRYAPMLQTRAASMVVEVAPPMLELARWFRGVDQVITWGEKAPATALEWDVQVEINELPYLFRTHPAELPLATRYLRVPPLMLAHARPEPVKREALRVGIVWACGEWNARRSISLDMLKPLLQVQGCEFWNLQGGRARAEWNALERRPGLHAAELCAGSLPHLAALIAQLDLVITPDTLAAHLAGALDVPAWVMLEHASDWRWQHGRLDSPWYPSLRLFRQPLRGDWASVLAEVRMSLHHHARTSQSRRVA